MPIPPAALKLANTRRFSLATAFGYSVSPMLDLGYFRAHLDDVEAMARNRRVALDLAKFREIDAERRQLITSNEKRKADRNKASEEIAKLKRAGADASEILARMKTLAEEIQQDDERVAVLDEALREFMLNVPNMPHASVPVGAGAADNVEVRRWGAPPKFDFAPRPHWEIGEAHGNPRSSGCGENVGCALRALSRPGRAA